VRGCGGAPHGEIKPLYRHDAGFPAVFEDFDPLHEPLIERINTRRRPQKMAHVAVQRPKAERLGGGLRSAMMV
jgi:hypothetical protein